MSVAITAFYSGILALIIVATGINVTAHRFRYGVMPGDGGQSALRRMARLHGNTVENIPLCALLMALYELNGGDKMVLRATGIALIAGRVLFAGPLWFHDGPSPIRVRGVTLTWATTALLAMLNILWLRS